MLVVDIVTLWPTPVWIDFVEINYWWVKMKYGGELGSVAWMLKLGDLKVI